jgi:hypothetical protein
MRTEIRRGVDGFWVGIQVEAVKMYTGTMINDLMATVERADRYNREQEVIETVELRMLASMYAQPMQAETVFMGAA